MKKDDIDELMRYQIWLNSDEAMEMVEKNIWSYDYHDKILKYQCVRRLFYLFDEEKWWPMFLRVGPDFIKQYAARFAERTLGVRGPYFESLHMFGRGNYVIGVRDEADAVMATASANTFLREDTNTGSSWSYKVYPVRLKISYDPALNLEISKSPLKGIGWARLKIPGKGRTFYSSRPYPEAYNFLKMKSPKIKRNYYKDLCEAKSQLDNGVDPLEVLWSHEKWLTERFERSKGIDG